ncbi:MAG: amidohydrolase [Planctomycetes bacterium]|nr:amidohydrolase [Planctomycetota bacterium]
MSPDPLPSRPSRPRLALFLGALATLCFLAALQDRLGSLRVHAPADVAAEPPAPVDWSRLHLVDVHAHIGSFRGFDLSLETLLANLNRHGVALVLVSNIDGAELPGTTLNLDETAANEETARVVSLHPQRLAALAWSRPSDPRGSAARVEPFLRDRGFVGVKFHPDMNHFLADDPRCDPYLDLCERYGVPAVFHCGPEGGASAASRIHALARRHKKVPVVLYHMGTKAGHEAAVREACQALASGDAQLYLETAWAGPTEALDAVARAGADRVLFGTDAPYYGAEHYARYVDLVAGLERGLSPGDCAKVLRGNAVRLFHLPP